MELWKTEIKGIMKLVLTVFKLACSETMSVEQEVGGKGVRVRFFKDHSQF